MKRILSLFIIQVIAWSNALQQKPLHSYRNGQSDMILNLPPSFRNEQSDMILNLPPSLPANIPGGSPLRLCNGSRDTDLYAIDRIELYPKPLYM
jgi:hypothetical protein